MTDVVMAENADTRARVIRTLDESGLSMLEDGVSGAITFLPPARRVGKAAFRKASAHSQPAL